MSTLHIFKQSFWGKLQSKASMIENWHGLYPRDNRFTYTDATLILPKKR
ncbi:hypothetical protein [Eremococcus coleocola]|uniref:Uncharacterized protein n=1 Tax=Eremococcus coleocola ACS-139-V-Col8 TaxID=908337 RepID=E4KRE2_9LACT|nr:hypothetical protein [Eremococcus coleocola]EFR30466.1 hypothetical protein HMPREF9257_0442 [Eremococcus coleocola ACS-139-V-Col8]